MMKKGSAVLWILLIGGLASCNMPARFNPNQSGEAIEHQYQAVSALLTQTAQIASVSTSTPVPPPTRVPSVGLAQKTITASPQTLPDEETASVPATPSPNKTAQGGKAIAAPCDRAQPGRPLDVTIQDDTRFHPGEYFSKTWRLINVGSCSWTRDYAVVWFSGTELGLVQAQPLSKEVRSGQAVDITIDMAAPQEPGTYQSNWKLRNAQGNLIGIGPKGDAPFWVRIVVVAVDTPTVTPEVPTPTEPVVVFANGVLDLAIDETADLDSGQINQAENDDLVLHSPAEGHLQMTPINGAKLVAYGISAPQLADCQKAELSDNPISLEKEQVGSYLCYRTTNDLPGRALIQAVDLGKGQVELEFVTWAVP